MTTWDKKRRRIVEFKFIKRKIEDHIAFLSLARADRLNAINLELAVEILESFKELAELDEARVIILKSEARIFCAGLDLKSAMARRIRSSRPEPIELRGQRSSTIGVLQ